MTKVSDFPMLILTLIFSSNDCTNKNELLLFSLYFILIIIIYISRKCFHLKLCPDWVNFFKIQNSRPGLFAQLNSWKMSPCHKSIESRIVFLCLAALSILPEGDRRHPPSHSGSIMRSFSCAISSSLRESVQKLLLI